MKRILLFFLLVYTTTFCFGQKILYDRIENDSLRCVETSYITARNFTDRIVWNYGLKAIQNTHVNDSVNYILIINLNAMRNLGLKENGTFLIKTFKDEVIELQNVLSDISSTTLGYSYVVPVVGTIGTIHSNDIYRNIAYFFINEGNLKMLNDGVKKVRVETEGGYVEKEYKKDKCGYFLYNSYTKIKEEYKKPLPEFSIKDGF